jgi:hypothetical protein
MTPPLHDLYTIHYRLIRRQGDVFEHDFELLFPICNLRRPPWEGAGGARTVTRAILIEACCYTFTIRVGNCDTQGQWYAI